MVYSGTIFLYSRCKSQLISWADLKCTVYNVQSRCRRLPRVYRMQNYRFGSWCFSAKGLLPKKVSKIGGITDVDQSQCRFCPKASDQLECPSKR